MTTPIVVQRALSLTQPWATLLVMGKKRIETRSWATQHRGWMAIHASVAFPKHCQRLCSEEPFRSALLDIGVRHAEDLPRGALLGVVWLGDCSATEDVTPDRDSDEYHFGNYAPGRYAWRCDGGIALKRVIGAKGHLGMWRLDFRGIAIGEQQLGPTTWGLM